MPRVGLTSLITGFADFVRHQLQLAPLTVAGYVHDVEMMVQRLAQDSGRCARPGDLTQDWLQEHLTQMVRKGLGVSTIRRRRAAIVCFSRFLRREGVLGDGPAWDLLIPRPKRRIPHFLAAEVAEQLVAQPLTHGEDIHRLRDHALLSILYEGGLRASEPGSIKLDELIWHSPRRGLALLRILGKGDKERFVPVRRSVKAVERYLAKRDELAPGPKERSVFLNLDGTPITRYAIGNLVAKYARELGLRAHPHLLRHTCASQMLLHGAELRAVQDFLGHANISTTALYAHTTMEHIIGRGLDHHPGSEAPEPAAVKESRQVAALVERVESLTERMEQLLAIVHGQQPLRRRVRA